MGEPVGVSLEGGRALRSSMAKAGYDMTHLKAIHKRAVDTVQPTAKASAPSRSKTLKKSVRTGATQKAGVLKAGSNARGGAIYAGPIHWGWFRRPDEAKGWRGGPIKPNSFLSGSARRLEPAWLPLYEEEMNRIIKTIKGK